ncbi:prenyltransferase/squalene oxidase repeat-containing protein [Streptomyces sp. NPDC017979]|uniref:labda-7,13-dienyl diphosphate synthase n=1 Tax=Streptomyces sp. NPDC017979 TaxID=3365024 RepID=UPI003791AA73
MPVDAGALPPPAPREAVSAAARLLASVDGDPWGRTSPTVYETARVHAWAPHLPGRDRRVTWLLDQQQAGGLWGDGPSAYQVLPTLAAVAALLAQLDRQREAGHQTTGRSRPAGRLADAVAAGVNALYGLPQHDPLPDTAAVELLVPGLITEVNDRLDAMEPEAVHPALAPVLHGRRLTAVHGLPALPRHRLAERLARFPRLPVKLHHCFEALAPTCPPGLVPACPDHLLGSSSAATAAWLTAATAAPGAPDLDLLLRSTAARYGGLFPETARITVFERLWVLTALHRAGLLAGREPLARRWVSALAAPGGVPGVPGFEPDADDTAVTLHLAAALGVPYGPEVLAPFRTGDHFACYLGEDTGSVSTNAHVLLALGTWARHRPDSATDHRNTSAPLGRWLLERQHGDGHWSDKWHASPFYATAKVTAALSRHGGPEAADALRSAARWVRETQRADGSWGIWGGTAEETAYAAQILLDAPEPPTEALRRAHAHLTSRADDDGPPPALWHDKTVFAPGAIVRAEVLSTLHRLDRRLPAPVPVPLGPAD